jgi:hypothetical protein
MHCEFELVDSDKPENHRCRRCGRVVASPGPSHRIHARCSASPPGLGRRLFNFGKAAIAHAASGLPTCTQEQIDARLAICRACPLFDGSICRHADCGCRIGQQRKFLNKLAWADQSCPLGKWNEERNHE